MALIKSLIRLLFQFFDRLVAHDQEDRDIYQWRYKVDSLSEEDATEALAKCTAILEKEPNNYMATAARANLNYHLKDYEATIKDCHQAIALKSGIADLHYWCGLAHHQLDQEEEAIRELSRAIELNQGVTIHALLNRGILYFRQKNYLAAIIDFQQYLTMNSSTYHGFWYCGSTYLEMQDYEKAIAYYNRAIMIEPQVQLYKLRAFAYSKIGRSNEVFADLEEVVRLDGDNPETYFVRATYYSDLGRYAEALADHNFALSLEPDNAKYLRSRGLNYIRLHRYDEAEADLTKAAELEPESIGLLIYQGFLAAHQQKFEEALAFDEKALAMEPDNVNVINNIGCNYYRLGDYEKAFEYLNKATLLDQNWHYAYEARGQIYFEQGKYKDAKAQFLKALELSNDEPDCVGGMAITHHALGEVEQAKTLWQQLVDKDERHLDVDWVAEEFLWSERLKEGAVKLIAILNEPDM